MINYLEKSSNVSKTFSITTMASQSVLAGNQKFIFTTFNMVI